MAEVAAPAGFIDLKCWWVPSDWSDQLALRFAELAVGDRGLIEPTSGGDSGPRLPESSAEIRDFVAGHVQRSSRPELVLTGPDKWRFSFVHSSWQRHPFWERDDRTPGLWNRHLRVRTPMTQWSEARWGAAVELARATDAVVLYADWIDAPLADPLFASRGAEALEIVRAQVSMRSEFGPWRGLSGVGWRVLLGREFVRAVGSDRLRSLGPPHVVDEGDGFWRLETLADPVVAAGDGGRAAESALVDGVGSEWFVDLKQGRLATAVPEFPAEFVPNDAEHRERFGLGS